MTMIQYAPSLGNGATRTTIIIIIILKIIIAIKIII